MTDPKTPKVATVYRYGAASVAEVIPDDGHRHYDLYLHGNWINTYVDLPEAEHLARMLGGMTTQETR